MINNDSIEQKKIGRILAWYFFQYSLLIPVMAFFSPSLVVGVMSILLVIIALSCYRGHKIYTKIFYFLFVMIAVIGYKVIFDNSSYLLMFYFVASALPGLLFISFDFSTSAFLNTCNKLAILNFFINCWNPFWHAGYEYMRFGYGMAPTAIFIYNMLASKETTTKKARGLYIVIFAVSFWEILFYGGRGAALVVALYIILDMFLVKKVTKWNMVLLLAGGIAALNLNVIVNALLRISRKIGIYSYSLTKMNMQLSKGWAYASSGRDSLYGSALNQILEKPILGHPINDGIVNDKYTHNLFLQLGVDLGIFAMIAMIILIIYTLSCLRSTRYYANDKIVLNVILSVSIGRLLFSSIFWRRPEFWMYIGIVLWLNRRKQDQTDINYSTA